MKMKDDYCDGNDEYDNADDDYDPKYLMFMENVKKDGKSYVLEVYEDNGVSRLWKYEQEDDSLDQWGLEKCDTQDCSDVKKRKTSTRSLRVISKRKKEVQEDVKTNLMAITERKNEVTEDVRNMIEEDYKYILDYDIISSYDVADEDYMSLLAGHQVTEKGTVKFYYGGQWLEYEADSDSDVSVLDPETFEIEGAINPFVPSKTLNETLDEENNLLLVGPSESAQSQFREELVRVLQKPYDAREYIRLQEESHNRKPIVINRDLRNGRDMMYSTNKEGKSYLDHFKDFKQELTNARYDQHKQLNLLRGLFFYLQNLTQPGAFIPWKDQQCLAVMGASR